MNNDWEVVDSFGPSSLPEPQYEGVPGWIARQIGRTGSRALETAIGSPKNLVDLFEHLGNFVPEGTRDVIPGGPALAPILGKAWEIGSGLLPSSENVKSGISQIAPEGFTEPQNQLEQSADSFTETLTSLLTPVFGGGMKLGKALKVAGAGNVAGEALKLFGLGETTQQIGKSLAMMGTALGTGPSFITESSKIYDNIPSLLKSEDEGMRAAPLRALLKREKKNFIGNEVLKDWANEIKSEIKAVPGEIPLTQLWRIKQKFPQYIEKAGRVSKQNAVELESFRDKINDLLKNQSPNKEFAAALTTADELYTAGMKSKNAIDWMKDTISTNPKQLAALGTVGAGIGVGLGYQIATNPVGFAEKAALPALGVGLIGSGIFGKGLVETLINSKSARSVFKDIMKSAVDENKGAFIRNASKLKKIETANKKKGIEPMNPEDWEVV